METSLTRKRPSDRKFGLTFAGIFIAGCGYGLFRGWSPTICSVCAISGISLSLLALLSPQQLRHLNSAWFALGELLSRVASPIALGVIFFALITPVSIISRLVGRDELHLKRRPVSSYWLPRSTSTLDPESFNQQF